MSLIIDYRKCRKAHQCCYLHPELFKADEVGAPVVLVDHPGGELRGAAEEAVELCPNGAISFREGSQQKTAELSDASPYSDRGPNATTKRLEVEASIRRALNGIETITGFDRVRRTSARHIFELLISGKQISMATLSQVELTALGCAFNKAISNGLSDVDVTLAVRVNWDAPAEAVIDICVQSYPRNLVSKKPYRGVNLFLLSATKYVSPFWLTMKQANQLGGSVRKGEHSQIVVFWKIDQLANGKSEADSEEHETDDKTRRRFVLRYYRLFNLEQCELPQAVLDKLPKIESG